MLAIYSFTIFLSAFLLFSIQLMVGKALLPILGGTPGVWNVCMVFFQSLLFAGYLYADRLGRVKKLHLFLWIVAAILAPHVFPGAGNLGNVSSVQHPILWILGTLFLWIGLPFLVLASTSTLIQHWFSSTLHDDAKDPYFLYAASNSGSLLALVSFPFFIEPLLSTSLQIQIWRVLFWILGVSIAYCSLRDTPQTTTPRTHFTLGWKVKIEWILCALIPSSLLLGVTTYISTDIAAIPLLWIVPLILYLLSFVLVYSRTFPLKKFFNKIGRVFAFIAILCVAGILVGVSHLSSIFIPLHLTMFFLACLMCHGRLAEIRPSAEVLSTYYLWISFGGVLGGMINSLLAPLLFNDVVEYPLMIILACWMRAKLQDSEPLKRKDWWNAFTVFFLICLMNAICGWLAIPSGRYSRLLVLGLSVILTYRKVKQVRGYALALLFLYLGAYWNVSSYGDELFKQRTFYGTIRVARDEVHHLMMLYHGTTLHGQQSYGSSEPLSYYHSEGPAGDIFKLLQNTFPDPTKTNVGIVGMGTGTLASYARKSENWSFYELDPGIVKIATNKSYFTFLSESPIADHYEVHLGDARIQLKEARDGQFSLLLMDAFSSDSIPTHLITLEAIQLEWSKVAPHGILAFHISNRYFDLVPVMASLAVHSGGTAFVAQDQVKVDEASGKSNSRWAVMIRDEDVPAFLLKNAQGKCKWKKIQDIQRYSQQDWSKKVWNDDYFDLFSLLFYHLKN